METQKQENDILLDFSGFEWVSFIPGETSVDDICVMHAKGEKSAFINRIIPEQYFSPSYCIQIVNKGFGKIYINNEEYDIKAYDGFLLAPDFLVKRPTDLEGIDMYILAISRAFMAEMNLQFPLSLISHIYIHPVWHMNAQKVQGVIRYFDLLREVVAAQNRTAAMLLVNSLFHFLAGEIANTKMHAPSISRNEDITGRFMHLVDAHCEQQHSLDWYADQLCLSTRYVANTIKETLGIPASSFIERALMQRAKTLLVSTPMPIQQIADQLGFRNQSHFGTFFKRHEGLSPAAFRKKKE